jgi:hypothetical protein
MRRIKSIAPALFATLLGACQRPAVEVPSVPTPPPSAFRLTASIQDIMQSMVDPSADAIWESVGTTMSARGIEDRQPHSDAQWQQLRKQAITLVEATNLLVMDGRRLIAPGGRIADQGVEGVLGVEAGQSRLDTQHAQFVRFAHGLHDVGEQMLAAIDARDPKAMVQVGSTMDEICEACHVVFWYPGQPPVK